MDAPDQLTAAEPTRWVSTTGGVRLAVHDLGGSGRPVLAAHATGFNGPVWRPLAAALHGAHAIALDFRAHGLSHIEPDDDLDWNLFADDVLATLDGCGWLADDDRDATDRPVGIGHSMGGAALLLAEQRRPGTFAGLWVYEPIIFPPEARGGFGTEDNALAVGARRRRPVFASREAARARYGSKPPMNSFEPDALTGYASGAFVDEPDGSVRLACRPEDESRVFLNATTCTAYERLEEVDCPVIVVRGRTEEFSPAAIAPRAADALPQGRLVAHDELSHFGPMENPVGLAAEIDAFIDTLTDT